jgi:hypothetical protein
VNIGSVGNLGSANTSYTYSGAKVSENIWIGNGPEASTPGIYSTATAADFCYGLGQNYTSGVPANFYMTGSNCGSYAGQTLTAAQIAADFPSYTEAYEWVGVVTGSGGAAPGTATIKTVNGQTINATVRVTKQTSGPTSGSLFSYVLPG